jgi:hypothetical protein
MTITAAVISVARVKAIAQENRASFPEHLFIAFSPAAKKYRPPRPMGVKGGCSPQNNRGKLRR